jgi:4-amino-4-deoxy-L-arabinose transferase-like glycosyltransferase
MYQLARVALTTYSRADDGPRMTATALPTRLRPSARAGSSSWRWGLVAVVGLAVLCRVVIVVVTRHGALFGDPVDYERWAVSLVTGHGFPPTTLASPGTPSAFRPPGYPLALAGLYELTGVHVDAARVLGALLGGLTVGLVATLGRALWGPRVGLVAGAVAAVYPPLIALNGSLVSESLFLPLELGCALALLSAWRAPGSVRSAAASGALCGLAALTRAVALPWVLVVVAACLSAGSGRIPRRPRGLAAAAAVAAFAAVLAPWTIRNVEVLHALVPVSTEEGYNLAGQYNATVAAPGTWQSIWQIPEAIPDLAGRLRPLYTRPGGVNEAQLDARLRSLAIDYARSHPGDVPRAIANDTLRLFDIGGPGHTAQTATVDSVLDAPAWLRGALHVAGLAIGVLALGGLAIAIRRRRLGPWWLWAIPALVWLVTVPALGTPMKRAPIDPFLILLAAVALEGFGGRLNRLRTRG